MATALKRTKTGLRLVCDVSARPVPRPRLVYPIPNIPVLQAQLLELLVDGVKEYARAAQGQLAAGALGQKERNALALDA